ncbi:MAG: hypothetical protein P8M62_06480 [Opitutae bacterium]|nr:hypothetical protein [Opitutales bacterium]MDB2310437.1 hypothetical protein [Opitutales bacterium]MDB2506486.1 hypothetical protein [Opitutales bacterium]MDG1668318.1 hypothetical protein [Opitutae bacterium]MDG2345679.1 hypothetical protein [Opitutae bacterium]
MKTLIPLFVTTLLLFLTSAVRGNIYEGFDMTEQDSVLLASSDATRIGNTSNGWASTWQVTTGKPLIQATDIEIKGFDSVRGSLEVRGERKPNSIGKGLAMRQIIESYKGDVYGSFRFSANALKTESSIGLLLSLPSQNPLTPRSATFAFCPKQWGSEYGMIAAGKDRVTKSEAGAPCLPNSTYLVIWQIENLPVAGKRKSIILNMWVLDDDQATHFANNDFSESALRLAELGSEPEQVGQYIRREIKNSGRGLFGGMIVSCFSAGMPTVTFDEIRISQDSLADAVGLSR